MIRDKFANPYVRVSGLSFLFCTIEKKNIGRWLVWLRWLSIVCAQKGLQVRVWSGHQKQKNTDTYSLGL